MNWTEWPTPARGYRELRWFSVELEATRILARARRSRASRCALAARLGVPYVLIEFPRPAEVVAGINDGKADLTITNASAARARDVDFTTSVIAIELVSWCRRRRR